VITLLGKSYDEAATEWRSDSLTSATALDRFQKVGEGCCREAGRAACDSPLLTSRPGLEAERLGRSLKMP
jgi:hypothetical protein